MGMGHRIIIPGRIPSDMVGLIAEIDEFKGRWEAPKNLAPDRLSILRKVATVASVGSSTRIEGAHLSDAEVEELLSNIERHSFRSRDEEEVADYAEAMDLVFDSFESITITENHIKQLHKTLLKYSAKDSRHKGDYKKLPNHVEAFDATGKSVGVLFRTATPFQTPLFMSDLVKWYATQLQDRLCHPLLSIGTFVVHFLAIHPFQDGNGRLSRILTTLMLLRNGYQYVPYCSLESIVEGNKDRYYLALRRAQASFATDHRGMEEWQRYFLQILAKQKDLLRARIDREAALTLTHLPALSMKILHVVADRGRATVSDVVALCGANRNTVKKHLKALVDSQLLSKHGERKGAWYSRT